MQTKHYHFIDVSGLGNSGKTAVADWLRDFDSTYVTHYSFEFDLFRLPGGLIDLYQNTHERWTPIRSHYALKEFNYLVNALAGSQKRKSLSAFFYSAGMGYEAVFKGQFKKLSEQFTSQLVYDSYNAFWPYDLVFDSPLMRAYKKFCLKFKLGHKLFTQVNLVYNPNFTGLATDYINKLFSYKVDKPDAEIVVLNNLFEPFHPGIGLNILNNSKQIVVIRDPRDIYVSGQNVNKVAKEDQKFQAADNNGFNKSFLATDNLKSYIKRQKLYFEQRLKTPDSRVMVVQFEDFIINHEETAQKIKSFLNLSGNYSAKSFIPANSAKNIGIYKSYSKQDEIKLIEKELKPYLYEK